MSVFSTCSNCLLTTHALLRRSTESLACSRASLAATDAALRRSYAILGRSSSVLGDYGELFGTGQASNPSNLPPAGP